jgi:hypothetical protein
MQLNPLIKKILNRELIKGLEEIKVEFEYKQSLNVGNENELFY